MWRFLVVLILLVACSQDPYFVELDKWKETRNGMMIGFQSPLPEFKRKYFEGLKFFEASKDGIIEAEFVKGKGNDSIPFVINKDLTVYYHKLGKVKFSFSGKDFELTAYQDGEKENSLFIPFSDNTSGVTTYGTGRYLYTKVEEGKASLDFNKAINPYCAYNHEYVCFPAPEENHMDIEVSFGEALFN